MADSKRTKNERIVDLERRVAELEAAVRRLRFAADRPEPVRPWPTPAPWISKTDPILTEPFTLQPPIMVNNATARA